MTEIDYAYLADYAKISDGKVDAIGASFNYLNVPALPIPFNFYIVGRIRVSEDCEMVAMSIKVSAPGNSEVLEISNLISTAGAKAYDHKFGPLFCLPIFLPLTEYGLHTVSVWIEGTLARELKFELGQA